VTAAPPTPAPGAARRILVLAPHPDDEIVGCAIAARRAIAAGARVFVLYLTTGVPARELLWPWQRAGHGARVARRRAEALAAARLLGLAPLGFQEWPARSLKSHLAEAHALIEAALRAENIDALWTPAWEGGHQDHDVASFLASRFAGRTAVREFAEYHFAGGRVRSQSFIATTPGAERLRLDEEERALKRAALALYRSERGNLAHIACAQEELRPLAAYDYAAPPHRGRLFWTRFHWVPFRHPRIDFERPQAVRDALAAFAAAQSSAAPRVSGAHAR